MRQPATAALHARDASPGGAWHDGTQSEVVHGKKWANEA